MGQNCDWLGEQLKGEGWGPRGQKEGGGRVDREQRPSGNGEADGNEGSMG